MSNEIKVGDRVRLVKGPYITENSTWNLGTVVKNPFTYSEYPYAVAFDEDDTANLIPALCYADEIEKV